MVRSSVGDAAAVTEAHVQHQCEALRLGVPMRTCIQKLPHLDSELPHLTDTVIIASLMRIEQ
jgi:hypothetical protein